ITDLPEGKYIDVNPVFEKISGFKKDEIIGKNIHELGLYVNPDDHGKLLQKLQDEGKLIDYEVTFQTK
ncbi:PAS domain-containing protein, partial [bacterium]|nr:PAS domain-containing protein [bacterium]